MLYVYCCLLVTNRVKEGIISAARLAPFFVPSAWDARFLTQGVYVSIKLADNLCVTEKKFG